MGNLWQDVRCGWRQLARNPGFAAVAILILALGLGAMASISSVVKGVLLNPLPFAGGDRLVVLQQSAPQYGLDRYSLTEFNYAYYRDHAQVFEQFAAYAGAESTVADAGSAERVHSAEVSDNFFAALDVEPYLGRWFVPEEDRPGSPVVVVLGHALWQRRFSGSVDVVGTIIKVDGEPALVAGVAPPSFQYPERAELWRPIRVNPDKTNGNYLKGLGLLRLGIALDTAKSNTDAVGRQMALSRPDVFQKGADFTTIVTSLRETMAGDFRKPLWMLFAAAGFLLMVTCFNVAGLLALRAAARMREMALRSALGAGRARLIRQLLAESLVLAGLGGFAGTLVAALALRSLLRIVPVDLPRVGEIRLDAGVLGFTLLATITAGLVFGMMPALRGTRSDLQAAMKDAAANLTGTARLRFNNLLVVLQLALSVVLLTSAGLLMRSFQNVLSVDPGFRTDHVLTCRVTPLGPKYAEREAVSRFYEEFERRIRQIPGVAHVGGASLIPLAAGSWQDGYQVEGQEESKSGPAKVIDIRSASPGYFEAMGFRLLKGRTFRETDRADTPRVAVIDEALARRHWPAADAIGKRIKTGSLGEGWLEIVGVVGTIHHDGFDIAPSGQVYAPYAQSPSPYLSIAVQAANDPSTLVPALRAIVHEMDAEVPVHEIQTMDQLTASSFGRRRFVLTLLGFFGVAALSLSAVGLYGVMSQLVVGRVKEMGIRVAVGARPSQILRLILENGLGLSLAGIIVGTAGAAATSQLVANQLFGVRTYDLATYSTVIVVLGVTAAVATGVPALRAIRLDPLRALRNE